MRIFAIHTKETLRKVARAGPTTAKRTEGAEAARRGETAGSEVDGGERGRAGVLLRGSVVKRIDPNHYDMSRLRCCEHYGRVIAGKRER